MMRVPILPRLLVATAMALAAGVEVDPTVRERVAAAWLRYASGPSR